jgi:hypothetical protein
MNREEGLNRLYSELQLKRLSPLWAKLEIALGLLATGTGIALLAAGTDAVSVAAGLSLFVLGGYLALAGHRSHLYQSNDILTEYLADQIRTLKG